MGGSQEPDSSEEGNIGPSKKKCRVGGTTITASRSRGHDDEGSKTVAQKSSQHTEDSAAEVVKVGLETDVDDNAPRHNKPGLRDRAKGSDSLQMQNPEHDEGHSRSDLRSRAVIEPSPAVSRSEVIVVDGGGGGREEGITGKGDDRIKRDNIARGMYRREQDAVEVAVTPRPSHLPDPDSLRECLEKYMEVRIYL